MKILYTFEIPKEISAEEIDVSTNEKGEKVSTTKTVKKTVSEKFGIKFPARPIKEEAQLYYGIKFSEAVKAGFLTNALIDKVTQEDGGVLTEIDKKNYDQKVQEFLDKQKEYKSIIDSPEESQDKVRKENLEKDLLSLRQSIENIKTKRDSIFDSTAETFAQNKLLIWWFLNLSLKGDKAFFIGSKLDDKLKEWDKIEESEDLYLKSVCQKLFSLISFYFRGLASTKEEFDNLLVLIDSKS